MRYKFFSPSLHDDTQWWKTLELFQSLQIGFGDLLIRFLTTCACGSLRLTAIINGVIFFLVLTSSRIPSFKKFFNSYWCKLIWFLWGNNKMQNAHFLILSEIKNSSLFLQDNIDASNRQWPVNIHFLRNIHHKVKDVIDFQDQCSSHIQYRIKVLLKESVC